MTSDRRRPGARRLLRREVLARAANRCESCGAGNHAWVERGVGGDSGLWRYAGRPTVYDAYAGRLVVVPERYGAPLDRSDRRRFAQSLVALAVVAADGDGESVDLGSTRLVALCGPCRAAHDRALSAYLRARRRKVRTGVLTPPDSPRTVATATCGVAANHPGRHVDTKGACDEPARDHR